MDALLRIEGETLVRKADWFAALGSTNDLALRWAADADLELPRLIWAETQTAGRGRGAHVWWAAPGGLTFSLIVDEASTGLRAAMWPQVSVLTGLAIAEMLSEFVPAHSIGLKWPNDVQVHGRKICGILVEFLPGQPHRLVIGVGINVGNSFRRAPDRIAGAGDVADRFAGIATPVANSAAESFAVPVSSGTGTGELPTRFAKRVVAVLHT